MATQKVIKFDPFKRGDTPVFAFTFPAPSVGFDWSGIVADFALTNVSAPANNTGAAMIRTSQALTVVSGTASVELQITVSESKALTAGATYKVELQLHDAANLNVATAVTGTVVVEQDYVI